MTRRYSRARGMVQVVAGLTVTITGVVLIGLGIAQVFTGAGAGTGLLTISLGITLCAVGPTITSSGSREIINAREEESKFNQLAKGRPTEKNNPFRNKGLDRLYSPTSKKEPSKYEILKAKHDKYRKRLADLEIKMERLGSQPPQNTSGRPKSRP